jgi:hypothetical protein
MASTLLALGTAATADAARTTSIAKLAKQKRAPAAAPRCGTVRTTTGRTLRVRVVAGRVSCQRAELILGMYVRRYAPSARRSARINRWSCYSSALRAGCRTPFGRTVIEAR